MTACLLLAGALGTLPPAALTAEEVFVTIGSGDFSGVYFPAALAIARIVNIQRSAHGLRATAESTPGSVFNLNAITAGYLEFGLAQADKQYQAVHGMAEWATKGPQDELRAVFSLHHETVGLVAAEDAGIASVADLRGKRVNLGNPGSGQHQNAIDILKAAGIDPRRDIAAEEVNAFEAPALLQDGHIDAFFSTVGHPSATIREAIAGRRMVRLVPIDAAGLDRLVAGRAYYFRTTIDVPRLYPALAGGTEIATVGVRATLCTSARVPNEAVYILTREVFENFARFRRQHPAFADLTREDMLEGLSAPLHPGARRYFEETGLIRSPGSASTGN
jgi:TRAP transporter TAXI family solute receptor